MSNKKKEQEAKAQWTAADQAALQAAQNIKLTPEAQGVLTSENAKLQQIRDGNYTNLPEVSRFLTMRAQQQKARDRSAPTGMSGLLANYNPEILKMQRNQMDREDAQATGAAIPAIIGDVEQQSKANIAGLSGLDLNARSSVASMMMGRSGQFMQNYVNERNKPGFWDRMMQGAGIAASMFSPIPLGGK